jgi:hypothetical protein
LSGGAVREPPFWRFAPPSTSETEFGPWYASVEPLKNTPGILVRATSLDKAGAPTETNVEPSAPSLTQAAEPAEEFVARKST